MEVFGSRESVWEVPRCLPVDKKNKELKHPEFKLVMSSIAQAENLNISYDRSFSFSWFIRHSYCL